MDRNKAVAAKINEYALGIPEDCREDFIQDMWVLMLTVELPPTNLLSFLNITMWRSRENWLSREFYRGRRREQFEAAFTGNEASEQPGPDARMETAEVLRDFVASLSMARLTDLEVQTVVDGFLNGLTQSEIAASIGRSPQAFYFYMKKFRVAA